MNTKEIIAKTLESPALKEQSKKKGLLCIQGNEYYVWVNSYGAVSAILPNGEQLGLKPDEFEVIEWHQIINHDNK